MTWKLEYCPYCKVMVNTYKGICGKCGKSVLPNIVKDLFGTLTKKGTK